jgi:hypothetical protein
MFGFFLLAQSVAPVTSAGGAVGLTDPLDWRHVVAAVVAILSTLAPFGIALAKRKGWLKDGSPASLAVAALQSAKARHDLEGGSWGKIALEEAEDHPDEVQYLVASVIPVAHSSTAAGAGGPPDPTTTTSHPAPGAS